MTGCPSAPSLIAQARRDVYGGGHPITAQLRWDTRLGTRVGGSLPDRVAPCVSLSARLESDAAQVRTAYLPQGSDAVLGTTSQSPRWKMHESVCRGPRMRVPVPSCRNGPLTFSRPWLSPIGRDRDCGRIPPLAVGQHLSSLVTAASLTEAASHRRLGGNTYAPLLYCFVLSKATGTIISSSETPPCANIRALPSSSPKPQSPTAMRKPFESGNPHSSGSAMYLSHTG